MEKVLITNGEIIVICFAVAMVIVILWLVFAMMRQNKRREAADNPKTFYAYSGALDAEHLTEAYDNGYIQGLADYLQEQYDNENNNHSYVQRQIDCINELPKIKALGKYTVTAGQILFSMDAWLRELKESGL